jgi:hypothetical protein
MVGHHNFMPSCVSLRVAFVELVEGLLSANKFSAGACVIFAGTELMRNVWLFTGFQPSIVLKRGSIATYLRLVASSSMHPLLLPRNFATVSPDGVATNIHNNMPQPMNFLKNNCVNVFACLRTVHSVETGAKRYVDAFLMRHFPEEWPFTVLYGFVSSSALLKRQILAN